MPSRRAAARSVVLDHDVVGLHERCERDGVVEGDADAALRVVHGREVGGALGARAAVDERPPAAVHVHPLGILELGDVGAHGAEQRARERDGEDVAGLEHLQVAPGRSARDAPRPTVACGPQRGPHHCHGPAGGVDGPQAPRDR